MIELYDYQVGPADVLTAAVRMHRVGCDASDCGVGKTIVACEVAKRLGHPVFVVAPKSVLPMWRRTLKEFGIEPLEVINYEKLRASGTKWGRFDVKRFEWSLPVDTLIIWDEAHKLQSPTGLNARMAKAAKPFRNLLLSATLAQDPTQLRAAGFLLGLHTWDNFYKWCIRNGCWRSPFGGIEFKRKTAAKYLVALHEQIFPAKGVRVTIESLGDRFPDNTIIFEAFDLNDGGEIQAAYEQMERDVAKAMCEENASANGLTIQLATRQVVELLRVSGMAKMAQELIESGYSVALFVNFVASMEALCVALKTKCAIYGADSSGRPQKPDEREAAINEFGEDRSRVIVSNSEAGGLGVDLNDKRGEFPRRTLISPTFNAKTLRQVLGRAPRAGTKAAVGEKRAKVVQYIVLAAGSVEEQVAASAQRKGRNIDLFNNGLPETDVTNLLLAENRVAPSNKLSSEIVSGTEIKFADSALQVTDTCYPASLQNDNQAVLAQIAPPVPAELVETRRHSPLSPSKLKAKAICVGYESDPSGDSKFADRGILGHRAVELEDVYLVAHDPQLKTAVEKCIGLKRRITAGLRIEQEVKLFYADGQYGYADLAAFSSDGRRAVLADYKFSVHPWFAESPQFHSYAWALWDANPLLEQIDVYVPVPFRDEIDFESWTRANDYERIVGSVVAIINRVAANRPEDYNVSSQCQYCARAKDCVKLASLGLAIARRYAPELALPDIDFHGSNVTDPAHFAVLLTAKPALEKAAAGWGNAALEMYDSGTEIAGFELATKQGNRSIDSARGVFDLLKKEVAPTLKAEDFLNECSVKPTAIDSLVKAATKRGKKQESVKLFEARLIDQGLLSRGGGSRFLRPTRL